MVLGAIKAAAAAFLLIGSAALMPNSQAPAQGNPERERDLLFAAERGEIVTVRDLVAGSGLKFRERGLEMLKGIDEPMRIFAAES